ncbi:protein NPGR2-like isoform X4 [Lycium ferocissimum]|uniref:protein NPGR2-like isoform X4 n=1 Tax=Lycium ferocissimum TaxID=112874 RepID=UPI0028155A3C|nr:protein NPGR2-like isoform X4 [Lycium ferocissimum]
MSCLRSSEQIMMDEMVPSPESLATKDYTSSVHSSRTGVAGQTPDTGNIEEAESSLRESGCLNYEEARALLGRYEYQKGNIEAALHVFEGIDIASVTPKLKISLAERVQTQKRRSKSFSTPPLSIHAASLLLEAVFLKAKSLQALQRYKEAAQSCTVLVDILESSLPAGLPETFATTDCKLQETLSKAVELLPELCKLADAPREAIMSYRRALLHHWNLDIQTTAKIQKEFAIFLLYSGAESCPPNLRSQMDGGLKTLASKVEELLPRTIDRQEMYLILALCYYGGEDEFTALNLLRKLLSSTEDNICVPGLLLASKVCAENPDYASEGIIYANRASESLQERCSHLLGVANCVLGLSLSAHSRAILTDSERVKIHSDALKSFESAGKLTKMSDANVIYHLCLENAEHRKLDAAIHYANWLLKLEGGSTLKGWMLLARVLSAQKRFLDAETVINVALEQSGKWDHGELLRTKAKLQLAQGQVKNAIETYTQLLAILQVQRKSFRLGEDLKEFGDHCRTLELETWLDLASIYIKLSQWRDAEKCLFKTEAISSYSACRLYTAGLLNQSKGLYKAALGDYSNALAVNPSHVPSLVSSAVVLRKIGKRSPAIIRSLLTEALRVDRMNASAWYNLGLLYKEEGLGSASEAAECFEAAILLEDTEPVEPFR